jgi:hypothetical protein
MNALGWLFSFGLLTSGYIVNFDNAPLGKTPPGWTVSAANGSVPRWEVRRDPSAPTQPYVFAQVASDPKEEGFSLAILNAMSLRDADVSVRFKPVSGREDQGGGLVFRYQNEKNYYVVRADAHDEQVRVYRVENGRATPLQVRAAAASTFGVKHDIQSNVWSILKVSVRGSRFQVYVNHRRILQGDDSGLTGTGKVGLATVADSVVYFDDFRVYAK